MANTSEAAISDVEQESSENVDTQACDEYEVKVVDTTDIIKVNGELYYSTRLICCYGKLKNATLSVGEKDGDKILTENVVSYKRDDNGKINFENPEILIKDVPVFYWYGGLYYILADYFQNVILPLDEQFSK